MSVTAKLSYLRISPRKVRLVGDLIRGKSVEDAQTILNFTVKKAVRPLSKLLSSAVANAKNNFQLEESNLYISKITVDEGPKNKRWRARARGSASEIQKKTSHITLYLDEIVKKPKKPKKQKKSKKSTLPQEEVEGIEKVPEIKKPQQESKSSMGRNKFKPEFEAPKPKIEKGIRKMFRRKSF
jgi:large subunit ribosomal protein L22